MRMLVHGGTCAVCGHRLPCSYLAKTILPRLSHSVHFTFCSLWKDEPTYASHCKSSVSSMAATMLETAVSKWSKIKNDKFELLLPGFFEL